MKIHEDGWRHAVAFLDAPDCLNCCHLNKDWSNRICKISEVWYRVLAAKFTDMPFMRFPRVTFRKLNVSLACDGSGYLLFQALRNWWPALRTISLRGDAVALYPCLLPHSFIKTSLGNVSSFSSFLLDCMEGVVPRDSGELKVLRSLQDVCQTGLRSDGFHNSEVSDLIREGGEDLSGQKKVTTWTPKGMRCES